MAAGETFAEIPAEYAIDPWTLAAFNSLADVDTVGVGQRLHSPQEDSSGAADSKTTSPVSVDAVDASVAASSSGQSLSDAVAGLDPGWDESVPEPIVAVDVPAYVQERSLSCEYAAAHIATAAFDWAIPESAFIRRIAESTNPHRGYRGNIDGAWGSADDYGVYPEALVPTLNEFGFAGDVFYSGDPSSLTRRLDACVPILTWFGYFGDTGREPDDAGSSQLAPGMHVITVYGDDDGAVYVSNPGRGSVGYNGWDDFLAMWSVLDGMALAVAPM